MKKRRKVKLEWARSLFGSKFFGADSIELALGFRPSIPELPDYWSEETLIRHAELGQILIYNPDQLPDESLFDLQELASRVFRDGGNVISRMPSGRIRDRLLWKYQYRRNGRINPTACFKSAPGSTAMTLRSGWQLVSPLIAYETLEMNQLERIDWLVENMWRMYPNLAAACGSGLYAASHEWWDVRKKAFQLLEEEKYPEVVHIVSRLRLNEYLLEPVANAVFRYVLYYRQTGRKLFSPDETSSCSYSNDGKMMLFGAGHGRNDYGTESRHSSGARISCTDVNMRGMGHDNGIVVSRMNF